MTPLQHLSNSQEGTEKEMETLLIWTDLWTFKLSHYKWSIYFPCFSLPWQCPTTKVLWVIDIHRYIYVYIFTFNSHQRIHLLISERGERKKHPSVASCAHPHWGSNPKPFLVHRTFQTTKPPGQGLLYQDVLWKGNDLWKLYKRRKWTSYWLKEGPIPVTWLLLRTASL